MNGNLKATIIGAACLVCCLPLIFTVSGATTGVAGAIGAWIGRYDLALIGALGLTAVIAIAIRRNPTTPADKVDEGRP